MQCGMLPHAAARLRPEASAAASVPCNRCLSATRCGAVNAWPVLATAHRNRRRRNLHQHQAASSPSLGGSGDDAGMDYKPYPRAKEHDPYRRLGLTKEAAFEEVQDARNYLQEQYQWHEPSKESVELAFDNIIQERLSARHKLGFRPPRTGRRGEVQGEVRLTVAQRLQALLDPTVTRTTLINEGFVFGALALWAAFAGDQSFPFAATVAYSVYSLQSKRLKRNPDGPFFGGNAIVGAILTTFAALAFGCLVMAGAAAVLNIVAPSASRAVGSGLVILVMGLVCTLLK